MVNLPLLRTLIRRNRYQTVINITALVCCMFSALLIAKHLGAVATLDQFHEKEDQLYAVVQRETAGGTPQDVRRSTYPGVSHALKSLPEVQASTRYFVHVKSLVMATDARGGHISFTENRIFQADSGFFRLFTFSFVHGSPSTALSSPNAVVLSERTARKYFGDRDPVGQSVAIRRPWGEETMLHVTAVTRDAGHHSNLSFDLLIVAPPETTDPWLFPDAATFVLLDRGAEPQDVAAKATAMLRTQPELVSSERSIDVSLEPFTTVHLSAFQYALIIAGALLVLTGWINFFGSAITQGYWRARELAILKIHGARVTDLFTQFLLESGAVSTVALVAVVALYVAAAPAIALVSGRRMLPFLDDPTPINIALLATFAAGAVVAAMLQTLAVRSGRLQEMLRDNAVRIGGLATRKIFVAFQFGVVTVLFVSVLVVSDQLSFLVEADKGYDMENVVVVDAPFISGNRQERKRAAEDFMQRCAQLPFVEAIALSTTVPGEEYRNETNLSLPGGSKTLVHQNGVDDRFFELYGVTFVAGRGFIRGGRHANAASLVLNESAARAIGIVDYNDLDSYTVTDHDEGQVFAIAGIVRDFHQTSLRYAIRPMAFKWNNVRGHYSFRLKNDWRSAWGEEEVVRPLKEIWHNVYPDAAFELSNAGDRFEAQEADDRQTGSVLSFFGLVSLIVTGSGLFAFSMLLSLRRRREVGIRKVLGATPGMIVTRMLREYAAILVVSLSAGSLLAAVALEEWLSQFAFRIVIGPAVLLSSAALLTLIFFCTIGFHTLKCARTNPTTVLK